MRDIGKRISFDDLPEQLISRLVIKQDSINFTDRRMLDILAHYEGIAGIDEVLVQYYRMYGEILERNFVTNKLYRMSVEDKIRSVPKRKGIYCLNTYEEKVE